MPLHPATQQLIRKVEDLSGRLMHVTEHPKDIIEELNTILVA